jgi:hypothetical protein
VTGINSPIGHTEKALLSNKSALSNHPILQSEQITFAIASLSAPQKTPFLRLLTPKRAGRSFFFAIRHKFEMPRAAVLL